MSDTIKTPFRPVRGTDRGIQAAQTREGYVYYATDTRKTYLGTADGKKLLMGYDTGIFYGKKDIPKNDSGQEPDPIVYFNLEKDIEGNRLPYVNDLILNVDGCFYRVEAIINPENVKTKRLTLQGTGTGGGGPSTGPSVGGYSWSMSFPTLQVAYSSEASKLELPFETAYIGDTGNYISKVDLYWGEYLNLDDETPFFTTYANSDGRTISFNSIEYVDITECKSLFAETNKAVTVALTDKFGVRHSSALKIRLVTLALSAVEASLIPVLEPVLDFKCDLTGATSGVTDKKLVYTFYRDGETKAALTLESKLNASDTDVILKNLDLSSLEHGVYKLVVQAFATLSGMSTTIPSNTIIHKVGYFIEPTSPLLLVLPPETTEQFTDIPVEYLYVTNDTQSNYTVEVRIDNVFHKRLNIVPNQASRYSLYFEDAGFKKVQFTVEQTGVSSTIDINLTAYTGDLPIIDLTRDDLMLYLNPKGKTNNDSDREVWVDAKGGQLTADLSGVTYSQLDGWCVDDTTGDSYLRLISGASLDMPDFMPFSSDPANGSRANGMTIELDFEIDGILDYNTPILSCVSYDITGQTPVVGFEIIGDKLKMYNNRLNGQNPDPSGKVKDTLTNQTIVEGKRIKVSMVIEPNNGTIDFPMCYTYLNGKISEATIYDTNDKFVDSHYPATLKVDSTAAQVKIYGIRFYKSALSDKVILNNYTALLPTLEERQAAYDSNNVYKGIEISYDLVSAEDYKLDIPYMKLTGGYPSKSKDEKWVVGDGKPGLPTGKKDYRFVDVEVVYPKYPEGTVGYFSGYTDYTYKNVFDNGLWMDQNSGNKASNGGGIMYCQGTSSMEYPTKNLRLRWKKDANFFSVRPNLPPVEIVCMKADYMESSGSHNTGAANLIDDIYDGVGMKTPGQLKNWDESTSSWKSGKRTVTCIKGHPCLIFYSESGDPGTYKYIGKYNLNLDKATPEPFGFYHDDEDNFGYLKDEEGNVVTDEKGNKKNAIFCYEFLDNAAHPVCNFLINDAADRDGNVPTTYEDTWYKQFWHEKEKKYFYGWRMGFESRYPEDEEGQHDADALYPLANWVNDLHYMKLGLGKYAGAADRDGAINKFKNEYWKYLDKDFTLAYYLITEALLMADSRVKNMMIATWGKEWRYRLADGTITKTKPEDGVAVEGTPTGDDYNQHFGYIFYPIFYDMDTMLGVNNEGRLKFPYYTEDTEDGVYNGVCALWHLVRDALPEDLQIFFSALEAGKLHAPLILPYFNENQATMANEAFYNGDAQYKYITPAREGYEDLLNDQQILPGAAPYLYALQGDRALHRESFINNRMQYLRGKYSSAKYIAGDRVAFRWYTPVYDGNPDNLDPENQSARYVPADGEFTFTGLKTGFAGVQLGENGIIHSYKFLPEQSHTFALGAAAANGTEAFLLGLSTLSDVGDLSNKYMGKFVISSTNNRIKRLTLGNPHKFYYNPNWADGTENIEVGSPVLEYLNLQNCLTYNRIINLDKNPVIKQVMLTGSGVTALTLPENGVLQELRLPNTLVALRIVGHKDLKKDYFSMGGYEYGPTNKIGETYEDNGVVKQTDGRYTNDFSKLTDLYVTGTPIDTYEIVKGANLLEKYYLHDIDWTINTVDPDQYCMRKSDWSYIDEATGEETTLKNKVPAGKYYTLRVDENKQFHYDIYNETTYPTGNNYLYEKMSMLDENNNIVCLPILEHLLTLNAKADDAKHRDALKGKITVNVPGSKVVELTIYDKYQAVYPNVVIEYGDKVDVTEASTVNFYAGTADKEFVENAGGIQDLIPGHFALTAEKAHTLAALIGSYVPAKVSTVANTYTFTGQWIDWADPDKTVYYQTVEGFEIPADKEAFKFENFKPEKDMDLVPVFATNVRKYRITLYEDDGTTVLATASIDYQADIGAFFEANMGTNPEFSHAIYNYKPYTIEGNPDNRWAFKGWQTAYDWKSHAPAASFAYLAGQTVLSDAAFYAYYKEENVYTSVSMIAKRDDFFDFIDGVSVNGVGGAEIRIKNKYRYLLQGKITLPATTDTNTPIVKVGDFGSRTPTLVNGEEKLVIQGTTKFTHVYFENADSNSYIEIGSTAFSADHDSDSCTSLEYIEIPASVRIISSNAFKTNRQLRTVQLHNQIESIGGSAFWGCKGITSFGMQGLPANLTTAGVAAFYLAGDGLTLNVLPLNLTSVSDWVFAGSANVNISSFGSAERPITRIGAQALANCGNGSITTMIIYCTDNALQTAAFTDYNVNVSHLTIYSPSGAIDETVIRSTGLKLTDGATIIQAAMGG